MNEAIKLLLNDYLNGRTTNEEEEFLRLYFLTVNDAKDPEFIKWKRYFQTLQTIGKSEYEVPDSFFEKLDKSHKKNEATKFKWVQLAASISVLFLGFLAGYAVNNWNSESETNDYTNEINELRYVFMGGTDLYANSNERMKAARKAVDFVHSDNPELVIQLLAYSLNTDPNVHVRLASAESLFGFRDNELAELILIQSLNTNQDPLVQWQLIQMIRHFNNSAAIPVLHDLIIAESAPDFIQTELVELWSSLAVDKTVNI